MFDSICQSKINGDFYQVHHHPYLSLSLSSCARDGDTAGKSNQYNAHDRGPIPSQGGGREARR